jgi:RNase H-like domain found in reverse transcriptase
LPLLIDVDSSVEGRYAAAVHQVPKATMQKENLNVEDIINGRHSRKLERPITYISKQLNKHEVHYWPTELEIAGIVWTIQKLRHLIEGISITKLFTDHKPAADILTSTTLKTSSAV